MEKLISFEMLLDRNLKSDRTAKPIKEWNSEDLGVLFDMVYKEVFHRSINKEADMRAKTGQKT